MIKTERLSLIPCSLEIIEAAMRDKGELSRMIDATVPGGWPHFPEALPYARNTLLKDPAAGSWWMYLFIDRAEKRLVGSGGFKGRPDGKTAEIGYEIAPECRGKGYATEAARGLVDYAFSHDEVKAVIAHTLAEVNASNSVLQKIGMRFDGEYSDPEDGQVWRWKIEKG